MGGMLFIPGPTEVRQEVLDELARPQIGHRTKEFRELFAGLKPGLKRVFFTENDVLISTSSGSGLWEAAIRSCVNARVLHAVNGAFSRKWASLSESCGKETARIDIPWGKAVKAEEVEKALSGGDYEALCTVHNETSTGVASDLNEISRVVKKHPGVLWIVDAVSSLGGMKIEVDQLGIDICLTSSQKALALPPGLAMASVSQRAYQKAESVSGRGYFFDLLELKKSYDQDETPYTPSIPHLYALKKQLERMEEEGLENRFKRHRDMADHTRGWAKKQGLDMFSEAGYHSDTVSCMLNLPRLDFKAIKREMAQKGYSIDSGYGSLNEQLDAEGRPNTFRIAHMGDLNVDELRRMLAELETYF